MNQGFQTKSVTKSKSAKWWRCGTCRSLSAANMVDPHAPKCAACGHPAAAADLRAEIEERRRMASV